MIIQQGDKIVILKSVLSELKSDLSEVRSVLFGLIIEKACKEIAFGIQDVNASSFLEGTLSGLRVVAKNKTRCGTPSP